MDGATATPEGMIPRHAPRHPLAIPVDVTFLRSGLPESIPGRSLNIGEGGLAAIVAGELVLGDTVGVEFRLPSLAAPVRTKAVVRHQARLRAGIQFVGLSAEQRAMIRYWSRLHMEAQLEQGMAVFRPSSAAEEKVPSRPRRMWTHKLRSVVTPRTLWSILAIFVFIGVIGWWRWYQ